MFALVQDSAVDLVGEDDQIVLAGHGGDLLHLLAVETPPVGLAGELMITSFVRVVTSEAAPLDRAGRRFPGGWAGTAVPPT